MTTQVGHPAGSFTADRAEVSSPYQGLMPYTEDRADLFFGRDQDILLIANNARAYPLSILYGPSGVGKSSVLQAGVLRRIRRENERRLEQYGAVETVVAYTSDWRDDPHSLVERAVHDAFERTLGRAPDDGERLDADAIVQFCATHKVDLLLILDQFEELFLYHEDSVAHFAGDLARLLRPGDRVNVLISIREDAIAQLDQLEVAIPGVFDNTLRLEHLDEESARAAITEPLQYHNERVEPGAWREIEDDLVDALIEQVQAGRVRVDSSRSYGDEAEPSDSTDRGVIRVEAPFLQLVLTRLWDEEVQRDSPVLRLSTLSELGGAEKIVRQHLDRVADLFSSDEQEVMADAFGYLVTPSGSKIAHIASDLAVLTSHDAGTMRTVLRRLCGGGQLVLREVPGPPDQPDSEPRFEIFHDVLALAVLDWRRRWLEAQQAQLVAARDQAELETRDTKRRLRRVWRGVSGLGILLVASAWFGTNYLQSTFCRVLDAAPACVGEWEPSDEAEATDFFLDYLGKAGGASWDQSGSFFVSSARSGITREMLKEQWGAVQWAGMTGEATALDGFNRFQVRYQAFQGSVGATDAEDVSDGSVIEWKLEVRLTKDVYDDNEVKILKILDWRKLHIERAHFPRVTATKQTMAYTYPTKVSDPTGVIDWPAGEGSPALCRTEVPLGSDNYWYRTRLGWVDGSDFSIEKRRGGHPSVEEDAEPRACPTFAAARATELEQAD